jgi:putative membrane-bound dehydrogenase-like protein
MSSSPHTRFRALALAFLLSALPAAVFAQKGLQPEIAAPLPPTEAAATMVVPPGFKVTLFAGEPDVRQPVSFAIDDRGRLWVAEAFNYPKHGVTPGDRIVIFEDKDGDGRFDQRTVFSEFFNYITGIEVGFGGVWVMSPPNFYFIPDRDGDDRPDGEPEVLLDGFGTHANSHNLANGFSWGPDGWLYNTHGRTNWSLIGKPGTPKAQRTRFDGGVWRYHPVRHVWEPVIDGITNPWAIDWDDHGQAFTTTSVDPHLYHVIPGAHYEPWRNRESSQFAYERIATIADHLHFVGQGRVQDGLGTTEEDAAGGGHSHCGAMIYLGDNWPDRYRHSIFMHNIHGRRINQDVLRRSGSGFAASHAPDFMRSRDPWFMGVILRYGPDGAVYSIDWSDTGECHSVRNTRKETGRIYKIAYGTPRAPEGRIDQLDDLGLVARQLHRNDWHVRHARRLLQERAAAGRDLSSARQELRRLFAGHPDVSRKLRALWALHVTGGAGDDFLTTQLDHENEYVRAWAIQLLVEERAPGPAALATFGRLAERDPAPLVRLHLASALPRLDPAARRSIGEALAAHGEDAADQNLPLMIWYGIEPMLREDRAAFVALAAAAKIPLVRRHVARRYTEEARDAEALEPLIRLLAAGKDPAIQGDIIHGLLAGLTSQGLRNPGLPPSWPAAYAALRQVTAPQLRGPVAKLALVFDDPVALAELHRQAADPRHDAEERRQAIAALVAKKPADLAPLLFALLADPATVAAAARGLAAFDHPETAGRLLGRFGHFDAAARRDAIQTLASRPAWASRLLDAVEGNAIPRGELTAYTARQLTGLGDATITQRTAALWGDLRSTPAEKTRLIANYRGSLTPGAIQAANRSAGRATYEKLCASCHRLFGEGGEIGPELTGSQRTNLDYLLENIIHPNAAVSRDYQLQILETTDGRVVSGFVISETPGAVTVRAINEKVVVPTNEIRRRTVSPVSMMPEGLLQGLSPRETQELIAYLASPAQVPLSAGRSGPTNR